MNGRGVICERWQVLQRGAREAYASGGERYIGGVVLRHDFIALSLDQE